MGYERQSGAERQRGSRPGTRSLPEFSRVVLRVPKAARSGREVPAGAAGTIVDILGQGRAYMVEFVEPFSALVSAAAHEVEGSADR